MTNIKIDHNDVSDALKITDRIIKAYGPRLPGSEACLNVANELKQEYAKWCDRVFEINYEQHPGGFFYVTNVAAVSYIAGGLLGFVPHLMYLSIFIFLAGLFYLITQFILFGSIFDRLFKKYPGKNVYGIIESKDKPKQQIIISAHHDSPYISNFLNGNQKLYAFRIFLPLLFYLYALLNSLTLLLSVNGFDKSNSIYNTSSIFFFTVLIFIIPLFWYNSKKGSPGAGDNLIAGIIGIKVAEIIRKRFHSLTHTRIIILSNDGEELGMKGAEAFIKQNKGLIDECETYVFNIDSIYRYEDLAFLTSDRNGTIHLSSQLADECVSISAQLGYKVKKKKFPFGGGGTDACKFANAGIKATSLIGISTNLIRDGLYYHTANDVIENLDSNAIEAAINIALNYILFKDMIKGAIE